MKKLKYIEDCTRTYTIEVPDDFDPDEAPWDDIRERVHGCIMGNGWTEEFVHDVTWTLDGDEV